METTKLRAYTKENTCVMVSFGIQAVLQLMSLLWNKETDLAISKTKYDIAKNTIVISTDNYIYKFENVPLLWDGSIDTSLIYALHIQSLKEVM